MSALHCQIAFGDQIDVDPNGGDLVGVQVAHGGKPFYATETIFLSPEDARTLRKRLKKAIKRAEGGHPE